MPIDLLLLITWTTWNRDPRIDEPMAAHLAQLLPLLAHKAGARMEELAIVATHVHGIVRLDGKPDIPALAQSLKGASARLINQSTNGRIALRWANGYDARSIGRRQLAAYRTYLDRQGSHHGVPLLARWTAAATEAQRP